MDGVAQLKKRLADYTTSLYDEHDGFREHLKTTVKPNEYSALVFEIFHGYLDDQFVQLQQLQDESNPEFVVEVVSLFFQDSQRLLSELAKALEQQSVDFRKVDAYVHQLKGSSSSIGAQRVQRACISFRNYCDDQNIEGCLKCLQQLKNEYSLMKNKLETLFKLEQQLLEAGG